MSTVKIKNSKDLIDADFRVTYLSIIEANLTTHNLEFLSKLAVKPTINASLSNPIKRGILKNHV